MKKSIQVNQISIQRIYTIGILIVAVISLNSCQDNEPTAAISSPPQIMTFGGSEYDYGFGGVKTSDGGFIITGYTTSNDGDFSGLNHGKSDIFVIKLNATGNKEWTKTYGGSGSDVITSVIQTQDGGYILTGASNSSDSDFTGLNIGLYDILVLKISSSGEKQWIKNFGGIGNEGGNSIIQTLDDGYVITGLFLSNDGDFIGLNAGGDDTFILKLNSSGEKHWVKSIGGSGDEYGNAIIQTTDGGLALTGGTYSHDGDFNGLNKGLMDMFVIKFNGTGEKQWLKTFGSSSWDRGYSILQTQDGGYALTGSNNSGDGDFAGLNKGEDDIFVLKLNATGEKQWLKTYGGSDTDYPVTILQLESGSFLITGPTHSNDGDFSGLQKGDGDIFVLKVNSSSGAMLSLNTFGGSEYDKSWFLSGWKDQGYCIIGETHSNDGDFKDLKKGITDICVLTFE